jgi:hypothetical protein
VALLGGFDGDGMQPFQLNPLDDRPARRHREQVGNAELRCFLDQPISLGTLDGGEGQPQVGNGFLLAGAVLDH